jgi:hypothetical protein
MTKYWFSFFPRGIEVSDAEALVTMSMIISESKNAPLLLFSGVDVRDFTATHWKTHYFVYNNGQYQYVDLKDGIYSKTVSYKRVSIDPQPDPSSILQRCVNLPRLLNFDLVFYISHNSGSGSDVFTVCWLGVTMNTYVVWIWSNSIPRGKKENQYFVIDNDANVRRRAQGKNPKFVDDCGVWKSASLKTHYFVYNNGQ